MISQASRRQCTVELQALPWRIGQVRRIVSAQLRYWNLDCLIDRAALGVTELLTNVHQHARPDKVCTVEISFALDRLTVSVHDHDPRLPVLDRSPAARDPLATSGRGLALIEAVSESWGAQPQGDSGKVVWFTLPAPSDTPVDPAPVSGRAAPASFRTAASPAAPPSAPAPEYVVAAAPVPVPG
ncbi:ATP-binding protein [Streptomyces sp. CC210A]|uniref:ATP-binding protein n=1 Tax=Streptomyces sp. CC210A TaxID=2898184 RepID=UPI001F40E427|nr:ATP-binding protein [Streptomyces sp. CC210A]